jgi:hypothetical protein
MMGIRLLFCNDSQESGMAKVTGIGGIFFQSDVQQELIGWLRDRLHLDMQAWGGTKFRWRERADPERRGYTVLSVNKPDNDYFAPSELPFMLNLRVDDLDAVLAELASHGIEPVRVFDAEPNGRFVHVMAPGGLKLELWQPSEDDPYDPA